MARYVDEAELVYRARFGCGPVPVRGVVFEDAHLLRLPGTREKVLGYVQGGVIHLPWRGFYPGLAAVHELHHLAAGREEPNHVGASWRAADWLGRAWWQEFWLH